MLDGCDFSVSPYDATIRVTTAFFAALAGIGLKHLLDAHEGDALAPYRVPCFLIAVTLFLRFLTGSANHLWLEHIRHDKRSPAIFLADFLFLVFFGIVAAFICYAPDLNAFLELCRLLLVASIAWAIAVKAPPIDPKMADRGAWWGWSVINVAHILVFWWFGTALWWIFGFSLFFLLCDLAIQLTNLEEHGRRAA